MIIMGEHEILNEPEILYKKVGGTCNACIPSSKKIPTVFKKKFLLVKVVNINLIMIVHMHSNNIQHSIHYVWLRGQNG